MTTRESELGLPVAAPAISATSEKPLRGRKKGKPSVFWRIRDEIPWRLELALGVLSLALPLALWSLLYVSGAFSQIFLPSPVVTAEAGYKLLTSGELLNDTSTSVQRVFLGFGLAVLVSVPLGLAMGTFRSIRALFEPAIGLIRYAPATAFVTLLIVWLGLGEESKIALVFIGTVFFNTLMTANVVWQVPSELIKVSRTLGAGSGLVFRKVIFPHALPGVIDSARVNLAAAWNLIVVAELFATDEGLGYRIVRAQKFLHIDQIFVVIVVIGVLGVLSDIALRTLRNRVAPWSQE